MIIYRQGKIWLFMNVMRLTNMNLLYKYFSILFSHYSITPLFQHSMKIIVHIILLITLLLLTPDILAQESADFIISGKPQVYTILNKYEQSLNDAERELFRPFSPLQIINAEYTLGDGITSAQKVRFSGDVYFFLKDDDGKLVGGKKDPYRHTFRKCRIIEDTIRVVKDRAILLSQKYPSDGKRVYMGKGTLVIRLFKYQNYYCVKYIAKKVMYGWCSLSDKSAWKREIRVKKVDTTLKSELAERIIERINSANEKYEQYFERFNKITGKQKSIPRWRYSYDDELIRCTLTNPYKDSDQLEESTQYLVHDIENLLIGKPFNVRYRNGEILVQLRD